MNIESMSEVCKGLEAAFKRYGLEFAVGLVSGPTSPTYDLQIYKLIPIDILMTMREGRFEAIIEKVMAEVTDKIEKSQFVQSMIELHKTEVDAMTRQINDLKEELRKAKAYQVHWEMEYQLRHGKDSAPLEKPGMPND